MGAEQARHLSALLALLRVADAPHRFSRLVVMTSQGAMMTLRVALTPSAPVCRWVTVAVANLLTLPSLASDL